MELESGSDDATDSEFYETAKPLLQHGVKSGERGESGLWIFSRRQQEFLSPLFLFLILNRHVC